MKKITADLILLISRLPFKFLYGVSTCIYVVLYYIVGYRKAVVRQNLQIAFPEKTEKERRQIEKDFYLNFTDSAIEILKVFSMKRKDYDERFILKNKKILAQEKNAIVLTGHLFNWEWLTGIIHDLPQENIYAIYKKVANGLFDELVRRSRSLFGAIPLSVKDVSRVMMELPNDGNHVFLFVADQSPFKTRIRYEIPFFGRVTPAFNGYDRIARMKDYAVFYLKMHKIARGKYEVVLKEIIPDNGIEFRENETAEKFYKELTLNIQEQPALWLWSHKRWKYTSGVDYQL